MTACPTHGLLLNGRVWDPTLTGRKARRTLRRLPTDYFGVEFSAEHIILAGAAAGHRHVPMVRKWMKIEGGSIVDDPSQFEDLA